MNKYVHHVYVIPEDDADRQIADGFILHHKVDHRRVQVVPPAGGWSNVLKTFQDEYIPKLRDNPKAHVIMLIDFDEKPEKRIADFSQAIPEELAARVFVLGSRDTPETLKKALSLNFEDVGKALADDCDAGATVHWDHDQLKHNDAERLRLVQIVKPFLF